MKRIFITAISLIALVAPVAASAAPYKLPASYRAVYCYPTGSYWQAQLTAYPGYYATHDAYYLAAYGATTKYCPV